jgi:hypothetical protein
MNPEKLVGREGLFDLCPSHPYNYALRHFEGSKTVWTAVGESATDALAAHEREQHLHQARKLAVNAGVTVLKRKMFFAYAGLPQEEAAAEAGSRGQAPRIET